MTLGAGGFRGVRSQDRGYRLRAPPNSGATANALLGKRDDSGVNAREGLQARHGRSCSPKRARRARSPKRWCSAPSSWLTRRATIAVEGGLAEKAGEATAVVVDKAHTAVDKAKPVASAAAKKTGEVVNKGAYATGKQIAATKGMFSGFKEEYDKARGPKPSQEKALEKTGELEADELPEPSSQAEKAPAKQAATKKQCRQETGAQEEHVLRIQRRVRQGAPRRLGIPLTQKPTHAIRVPAS